MRCVFKHEDLQIFGLKIKKNTSNFYSLEVVGRGSETQLQVGENLFFQMYSASGVTCCCMLLPLAPAYVYTRMAV